MSEVAKKGATRRDGKSDDKYVCKLITGNLELLIKDPNAFRTADFAELEDPKASVKSIQAWAINLNNILRGFSQPSGS